MYIKTIECADLGKGTYVGIIGTSSEKLTLKVLDIYGRIAKTIQTQIEDGRNELMVNISDLKMGNYVVNAFCGGRFFKAIKFVKSD